MRSRSSLRASPSVRLHGGAGNRNQGFTLTEMLVALFIFSLIGLASWQLLSQASRNHSIQGSRAERLIEINRGLNQLAEDVHYLVNRPTRPNSYSDRQGFFGASDAVEFVRTSLPPVPGLLGGDMRKIHYGLRSAGDGRHYLDRTYSYFLDGSDSRTDISHSTLSGVLSVRWSYLDDENAYHLQWPPGNQSDNNQPDEAETETGASMAELPRALRMDIELDDYGKVYRVFEIDAERQIGAEDSAS